MDVTKTGSGEWGAGNGERKSGNELSAEASTKIQNGGPNNEREEETSHYRQRVTQAENELETNQNTRKGLVPSTFNACLCKLMIAYD